ncbi:hypothetical protein [Alicyclobacillus mengziensis]|uniref:Uncharacterized protein n=1 Tax=Alicyclobacillus mengziensis TaxID=2931921 RepID=A0A9X7W336_9BACL|nr:hypothetical protein [Alicyclobacillus mengziensis]QSO49455.1 hypothetical protein JZ786_11430 [Alicyclobacillus mengziensis]
MRTIRLVYRVIRLFLTIYGAWNALAKSRSFAVVMALIRILRRRRVRSVKRAAALTFVDGSEPAIYRREGWRRITLQKSRRQS